VKALKTIVIGAVLAWSAAALADEAKQPTPKPPAKPASGGASAGAAAVVAPPPKTPPPTMPEMKPAQEVTDAAKLMTGSYSCKGNDMNPDGSSRPSIAKLKISSEMDGYYILVDLAEQKSKQNPTPFKAKMYRTFDASKKMWVDTIIASAPGQPMTMTTTDSGMGTGKIMWTGSAEFGGQKFMEHGYEEPDAKTKSVHIWGEVSMDGGKTFAKEYDITCKK